MSLHVPEAYRVRRGAMRSDESFGNNGAFVFRSPIPGRELAVIASDGRGWSESGLDGEPWEHVSVHVEAGTHQRTPTWIEMAYVKDLFWDPGDVVIQIHPAKQNYVNNHANTLHLWRPTQSVLPIPPAATVGFKELDTVAGEPGR